MNPVQQITSRTAVLVNENIDTDRIIPARFLTTTSRSGLGAHCFHDWRYRPDGSENTEFPIAHVANGDHAVLVAGRNFGCGSSREHAPWALLEFGVKAVISSEIADIFRSNALKNGLVAVVVAEDAHKWLLGNPGVRVAVDIEREQVMCEDGPAFAFSLEPFARHCLLHGVDQLGFLLQHLDEIRSWERCAGGAA